MWPFVGLLILEFIILNRKSIQNVWKWLKIAIMILLPIGLVWLVGAIQYNSLLWIISTNLKDNITSRGALLVLNGIVGNLSSGNITDFTKGAIVSGLFILEIWLCIRCWKSSLPDCKGIGVPVLLGLILLCMFVNREVIWSAVRFGRLVILPLFLSYGMQPKLQQFTSSRLGRTLTGLAVLILFSTNFFFTWYVETIFFK
jgi:hypothetical protein